jgi:tetratricopeptide (TPR) repeat protein
MASAVHPSEDSLPPEVLRRINALCLQFERVCQAGPPWPRLEDFLSGAEASTHPALLRELLTLELHYRRATGETVRITEYEDRFPGHDDLLQALFPSAPSTTPECYSEHDSAASGGHEPLPTPAAAGTTGLPPLGARTEAGPRFQILRPHARGGLGEVFVAHDCELNRQVALKEIKDQYVQDPDSRARFVLEAEVTGSLEHPGIVPIYSLGRYPDGRPFYAMRFIHGDSLKDALERFHQAEGPKRDPGQRSLELRKLLGRFLAVCDAIAYAHSRGVLHRDLKPSNILVGPYGETLVIDWGLAKPGGRVPTAGLDTEPALRPSAATAVAQTLAGAIKGTAAYMSPEQALGRLDLMGPASDVYSLGATLYYLLTGHMPFEDKDINKVLRKVRAGTFKPPRQENRHVPAALDAVCRKAMAREAKERYPTPTAFAEDIEHWLADEPVSAYREPLPARTRRWARRHKPMVAGLAAMLLTAVALGGGGGWWLLARQRDAEQKAGFAMGQARQALAEGWETQGTTKLAEARAEADKAVTRAEGGAGAAVRAAAQALREEVQAKSAQTQKNKQLRLDLLDVTEPRETKAYQKYESGQVMTLAQPTVDEQFAAAFRSWGVDVEREPVEQVVARLSAQPGPVVQEVVAGLDEWALVRRQAKRPEGEWRRLSVVAEQLDGDPRRRELRRLRESGALQQERAALLTVQALAPRLAVVPVLLGLRMHQLRELARQMDPAKEPVLGVVTLARALNLAGDAHGAEGVYRSALASRPGEVVLLDGLGQLLERQRPPRWGEAIECYRAARAAQPQLGTALAKALQEAHRVDEAETILRDLVRQQPDNPETLYDLGNALHPQKKYGEAEAAFRKAVELKPDFTLAFHNLGSSLADQKRYREAEAAYRKAIALKPDEAVSYKNLAYTLVRQNKYGEAEAAYRKAIEIKPDLATAYSDLGDALNLQKKHREAETACRKAIALQPDFAYAYNNLGIALAGQRKHGEAEAAYRKAIALQPDLAGLYDNLGSALNRQKRFVEAEAVCRKALALQPDLDLAYSNLGAALNGQKRFVEAEAACRKAIQLQPDDPNAYLTLGNALTEQRKLVEAEAVYRKAIQLQPDDPNAYYNLGCALEHQNKFAEAEAAYHKAIELQPDYAGAYNNLGNALFYQQKLGDAEAAYRKAIVLQPDYAMGYNNLGELLYHQKKLGEAEAACRKAIELRPNYATAYNNLGLVLADRKRLGESVTAYRQAIAFRPNYAAAYNNLGIALRNRMKLGEALAAFRKADQLLPGNSTIRSNLRLSERWLQLEENLPVFLGGKKQPSSPQERLVFASFCSEYKHLYLAAVNLYFTAFATEPKLADDLRSGHRYKAIAPVIDGVIYAGLEEERSGHRYNAACAAALAAAGKGDDAGGIGVEEWAWLQQRALDWLRADLTGFAKLVENGDKASRQLVQERLAHWQQDADLIAVRDQSWLAAMPEGDRVRWQKLWADVVALQKKAVQEP